MTPRQTQVFEVVKAAPDGLSLAQVVAAAGVTRNAAQNHLAELRRIGKVSCVMACMHSVWCLPSRVNEIRQRIEEISSERTLRRKRASRPSARRYGSVEPTMKQVIVPAATAKPIVTRGVSSVWEWGRA